MTKNTKAVLWSAIVVALGILGNEVAAGHVPIPASYAFVVPVLLGFVNALTPNLRRK